ncbi:ABC transporter substrate-binding protein [uncultured Desulfosarcina sp.]|uniref:ABC transporter substrate-binding protein n=1 Tax=uncultured Desulfosarcina sp. TaxID=218289 RepID=UPI0029C88491|nr:ABC transporter substrate-binding protein [uncultured Desulfosarcina sp.]
MKMIWNAILLIALAAIVSIESGAHAATIRVALDAEPNSLDPQVYLHCVTIQYAHMAFDPLLRQGVDGTLEPRLAEKWEQVNSTTIRFYLRKGVTFHSGNPFTAEDVAFTLQRLKKSEEFKGLFEKFSEVKIRDTHTVDLITKEPYAPALLMATHIFPMDKKFYSGTDPRSGQPKDIIVKGGYSFANVNESGTGFFRVSLRKPGVKTVYTRFENYWDENTGNIDTIIYIPISDSQKRLNALLAGEVDFIYPVQEDAFERFIQHERLKLVTFPGSTLFFFELNQKRCPPFADIRVRKAMIYAYDNIGVVQKILNGFATPATQNLPKAFLGHNPDLQPRYNVGKARQLMAEAGYEKGFSCSMIVSDARKCHVEIARAFASMMDRIGIKVALTISAKGQYIEQLLKQVTDIRLTGWHPDAENPVNYFEYLHLCSDPTTGRGAYNSRNYCNPEVDRLTLLANRELDKVRRAGILQKIEKILYEDAAFIPVYWSNLAFASINSLNIEELVSPAIYYVYFGDLSVK